MFKKLIDTLYKLGILQPYKDIDRLRYHRRLRRFSGQGHPYVSDKDQAQFSDGSDLLIRSGFDDISALLLCNPASHIDRQVIAGGLFSNPVIRTLIAHAANDSAIIDVGANIGAICIPLGLKFPEAEIYAFEPNPYALSRLKRNVALNQLENINIFEKGVGSCEDELEFNLFDDASGDIGLSSFLTPRESAREYRVKKITVITLDSMRTQFSKPVSAIKIDVQGLEADVLEGAENLVASQLPIILFEHEDINFSSHEEARCAKSRLSRFFDKHHYSTYYITRYDHDVLLPVQWENDLNGDVLALPGQRQKIG